MHHQTILLALSFVIYVTASPVVNRQGISVPLHKRSSLTNQDGTFNHLKAALQTLNTRAKHRQNMLNIRANIGQKAFPLGAFITPVADLTIPSKHNITKRQNESLTDEQDDTLWTGSITIGSQPFVVDFDTGSSDLWVPSSSCDLTSCTSKAKYVASPTSSLDNGTFSIEYGDGSSVSGPIYTDTVTVAGITVSQQTFSPVTVLSSSFADRPFDGILGMALFPLSSLGTNPFFVNAFNGSSEFGLKLAAQGSQIYLGGTNADLFSGSIQFHPVTSPAFWQISNASVTIDSSVVAIPEFDTIIDSGTSIMYGPPTDVQTFYSSMPGAEIYDSVNGYYSFPCNAIPEVAFSWNNNASWSIDADNFNLGETAVGSGLCVGAMAGLDLGLGTNVWLLGDSFLKNVYTAFSLEKNTVGFATLV